MGAWLFDFDSIAIEGWTPSLHPSFSVTTEKDTINFKVQEAEASLHPREASHRVSAALN